jgi:very-short-patch-repair endonuclease
VVAAGGGEAGGAAGSAHFRATIDADRAPRATPFTAILQSMATARREVPDMRGEVVACTGERAIAALAARQHGVVTRAQLRLLGLKESAIDRRVAAGRLHRLHRGVYAVGHRVLSRHGRWMAAVLACGGGAALSHASAAALWELRRAAPARVDVTVPAAGGRARRPIRVHRVATLRPHEVTIKDGIPVTTPARTILDLAATLQAAHLESVLDRNEILELTDYPSLAALARAHLGHNGSHKLLATMQTHDAGANLTRSDLEIRFRQLCHDHGLPQPRVNTTIAGKEVDFLFEPARLIVETDSWRYHKTRRAFEDDRARDVLTTKAGYRTLRFTDRQLADDSRSVAAAIRATLHS